jgi:hypothetical protein
MEGCKCKPAKSYAERIIEYREFVSLVKRMREAQMECAVVDMMVRTKKKEDISEELMAQFAAVTCNVVFYEDKVDEYLKKMEI